MKPPTPKLKKKEKYCSYCGKLCNIELVGAEEVSIYHYTAGKIVAMRLATAYDEKTGKKNECRKYICPEWIETKWYEMSSPHDNFIVKKLVK